MKSKEKIEYIPKLYAVLIKFPGGSMEKQIREFTPIAAITAIKSVYPQETANALFFCVLDPLTRTTLHVEHTGAPVIPLRKDPTVVYIVDFKTKKLISKNTVS
jgi:hypothetical protein